MKHIFSGWAHRTQSTINPLYLERNNRIDAGAAVIDLISGNVNQQGIYFPEDLLQKALAAGIAQGRTYRPDPRGQLIARQAIAGHYRQAGLCIPPERIFLTTGTSLSYWYAFALLANRGDHMLVPCPTYPLFDTIADILGIQLRHYRLNAQDRWRIDLDHLASRIGPKTRGILLISPHNPTGNVASASEIEILSEIALRHGLPIISDEVFSPFIFRRKGLPRPASTEAPFVITLNGLSKMYALPGLKIGWMAFSGDPNWIKKGVEPLETLSDAFLPVQEAAQFALPMIMNEGKSFLASYRSKIKNRAEKAFELLSRSNRLRVQRPEGGFYITAEIRDRQADDEALALDLLKREGVLVHPGYLYDAEAPVFVISCVPPEAILESGISKLIRHMEKRDGEKSVPTA
ncbi:MAG: pyridoxal phosphate-dependent aminotransferase [Nitrospiria bacterium]